jgi:hypothetical protein
LTLRLEAVSALKVKRPKLGVSQALLSAPDDTALFSTYDDFVTATRRLKADRALEDDLG